MSNYWKKKLDELEKSKAQNTAKKTEKTDYWQNKMTELEKETERKKADIAPVKQTVKDEEDKGSFGKWLGNTAMGGLASFNKGITATADLILGGPLKALGWEDNPISKMADYYSDSYDEYKEKATAEAKLLGSDKNIAGMGNEYELAGAITESTVAALPTAITALMTMGTSLGGTAASMGGSAASSSLATTAAMRSGDLLTKAGLTAQTMAKNPQYWLSFAQTYGADYEEAVKSGVDENVALYGSLISSLVNAGVEIGIDGGSGIQGLPNKVAEGGKSAIFEWVQSSLEEGGEEILQGVVSRAVSKMTGGDETVLDGEQMLTEGAMGTVVGGLLGGGQIGVQSATNAVTNAVQEAQKNKLTETEQKVVDKVVESRIAEEEADGKELTAKDKKAIEKQVRYELDKGYISTDTIEETLGGDTYKTYRDTVDSEDALREEFDTLNQMKQGEMTGEQMDRRTELKQQLEDLKTNSQRDQLKAQLSDEVFNLAKDTRLAESYNEQSRRGNAFEADLSKYDTKQQAVVQKAIDSGILNNTNRTHEFVDMIAKISADKGVSFDFTNNAKLKESGFAVDGATVNGYVTKDGIALNIDSSKSTRSVAGHEITHILEGTELYTELQNTIFEYAKSKGEYDSRLSALTKLYENVDGADVNAELTADLVGDYLFDDVDFIHNLSTQHRNVFEKIYDEIKYLCKVATAGSKEARELERVRKAFADAYRADSRASGDTKWSLSTEGMSEADQENAQKVIDNLKARAGASKYLDGYATYTDERMEREIRTSSASHIPDYAKSYITWVDPIDFVYATTTSEQFRDRLKEEAGTLDIEKLKAETQPIHLTVNFETGEIVGHEGRHRMLALSEAGVNKVAVIIDALNDNRHNTKPIEFMPLKGQKFGGYVNGTDMYLHNMLPLSQRYADTARKLFTNKPKSGIQYSLTDNTGKELSKGQQDYFKDSKMRDDDGNLMVMYHGSQDAGFHEFNAQFSDDDTSFFFVDRNDVAASYSGTSEVYEAKTIRTAEDMNNFLAEIGYDQYEAVEQGGKFELLENGEHVAYSDTAKGIYKEFCWYEGVGDGDANYKVYLNLTNPLVVDAGGRNWNNVSREYSQEIADRYNSLTDEEKAALTNLAEWGEYGIFKDEMLEARATAEQGGGGVFDEAYTKNLASAYEKLGGANANLYDAFSIASDNFSEESINQFAVKQMNTRDYAKRAKEQGYDGVIFKNIVDNGGYSNGSEGASTVAIAFNSNQIKSTANVNPTTDADIRYSLTDNAGIDGKPIDGDRISHSEFNNKYSLSHNAEIAKGQNDYLITHKSSVTTEELAEAQRVTAAMVDVMMKYSSILPEDKIGKVLTKNGSYDRSVENTTICVRTLAYNEFVDKVQEEIGRPLTQMESFLVSQKMYDIATDPQCLYCYVSLDRKAFNDMLLRYMQDRDTVIAKYNNSDKTDAAIEQLYEEFLHGRKPTKEMRKRFDSWISYVDNGTQLLSLADIATEARQADIAGAKDRVLAEQLKDARKYAQSASWSKIQKDYVAYKDEILKLGDKVVKNLNEHYGMRWYSFSDYSAAFIVENMQQITDASIRGLKGLSYTKDTDYAEIFAPSGMNINISVFVNTDADGNFFIDEKQSANLEKALKLREEYPNVGIVATVTNDEALRWAGEQEWTDVIIPFHIVRTGTDVAEYYKWLNYTAESADTIGDKDMWTAYLDSLNLSENARKRVSKNIYPSEHKNDKNTYLNLCESRGLTPRFARFAGEDWYMKLVNETRLSADNSSALKPIFNEDAAKASFDKFIEKGGYEGGWYRDGVDVDSEAKAVAADVLAGKKANEVSYGRQDGFVPEDLIAGRKTNRQHGKHSLSYEGEMHHYGRGDGPMSDLALKTDVAPVQDSVQDVAPVVENNMTADDMISALWDAEFKMQGYNPNAEADASEQAARDAFRRIGDKDAPPETEAPYYGESKPERANDPFLNRDWDERKTKAFTTDNPDAKPFFQEEAQRLAADYAYTEKAERGFSQEQYYNSGGERGFYGWSRMAADDINTLMDVYGLSYAQIEDGLDAIIHDTPKVNNKPAKTIEFILNKRMLDGYKAYYSGEYIPPNQGYIEWLNGQQNAAEYAESTAALTDADAPMDIAPTADSLTVEDVMPIAEAPVAQKYEAIKPKAEKEPRMAKATPAEQARADILTEEPQKDKKKGGVWSKIKNNVLDKGMVFEDLSLATGNRELQARWNSIRYAEGKAQRLMGEGNASVKSLNSIRDAVDKTGKTQQFYEYLYHQHNVDRMTLAERYENVPNKTVFGDAVTADVSRTAVAELEKANPEFKQYAKDVYDYMTYLRGLLVEGGVISNETAKLWQEMYPHYVPIRRLGDEGLNINVPLDTGRTGVNAPIKRAKGGNRDILPLFDTMGQRTIQTFKAIAKNRFGVELKNTLGTTIESDALGVDDAIDSIDTQDGLLQEGKGGKKPTFTVFENGEKVTFEITDEMYDAMKPTSEGLAYTNKVLNTVGNIRRGTLTEYNPWFMLKNAVKDVQDVLINSQHATRTYAAIPKAIKQMATKGHWYQEYLDNGGEQNTYFDNETNTFAKENKALEIAKKVTGLDAISKANNIIERLPRLAEYIASREAGRSVDVSMLDAARVTTNFAAGGDLAKFANRNGATFLNASIQGAMQQARNIREAKANGLKGWAKLAGVYTLAGLPAVLLNHLIWDDDEEYEELSDYVKQNYYIVGKFGDGKFVRIPKGRTVAVIQNAFKQMDNAITGDDEVDLKAFVDLVVTNLAPNNPVDNNILSPIIQVANNETWYGEDLVPTRLQDLPAAEQYDESTDAISRWLGEKTNTSPYKWNYLLDQYSGVVGDTFLPMLTPEAESGDNTFGGNMIAPLKDMFSTDSVMKNQNVSDFYDKVDELTTNAKGSKATDEDVLKYKYMNSVNADLGELYGQKREIQNSDLPDDIKYNRVREIQRQIDEMAEEALGAYGGVSITGDYATVGDRYYHKNDEGEWVKVTDEQLEKQDEVTSGLGITPAEYWGDKDEYDMAYEYPEKYALLKENGLTAADYKELDEEAKSAYTWASKNPGKYTMSKAISDDLMTFYKYKSDLGDIYADKDENGESISGSAKEKKMAYIESLDLDYGQKLILHRSMYDSKKDKEAYNSAIVEYLDSREDISWEDMKTILEELDFTVYDDGRITW